MAIIPQAELFSWDQVEASSDLDRLKMILTSMPDEALMRFVEAARGQGRDDYPVRAVWNSVLVGIVFEHKSVESLRRVLSRNRELREMCGFDPFRGAAAVPPAPVYSRFLSNVFLYHGRIDAMFDELVETLRELLPRFGTRLATDSKAVDSHGRPTKNEKPDGRLDTDGDWGTKSCRGVREDGTLREEVKRWFGYRLHLLVDAEYELPVAYSVTKASTSDCTELLPLMGQLDGRPGLLDQNAFLSADKGYDSKENNRGLWDIHEVKPIIDIRKT